MYKQELLQNLYFTLSVVLKLSSLRAFGVTPCRLLGSIAHKFNFFAARDDTSKNTSKSIEKYVFRKYVLFRITENIYITAVQTY